MAKIEPDINKYGSLARATFFADYLEYVTLRDRRVKLASLRDLIADSYSSVKNIILDPEVDTSEWVPTDLADEAWTCLLQRADVLGDLYPFEVAQNEVLKLKSGFDVYGSTYVGLLAIAIAHAFKLMRTNLVEHLFEDVVADAIESVGIAVGRLGPLSREHGFNFVDAMDAVAQALNVPINPNATQRRAAANDEDVDLIGHLDWKDRRKGRWYFICQVTCAVSDEWRGKATEPVVRDWMEFLGEITPPTPFLAIPHHADDAVLKYATRTDVNILDRPRLVLNLPQISLAHLDVIVAIMNADYQSFKV